jgi:hypothetical protein
MGCSVITVGRVRNYGRAYGPNAGSVFLKSMPMTFIKSGATSFYYKPHSAVGNTRTVGMSNSRAVRRRC